MEFNEYQVSFYHNLIGVIRCIIELVRIDISFEVSDLSRCLDFTRTGHLVQYLHIFKYLEIHSLNDLSFDICYQRVTIYQDIQSKVQAMKDLYVDIGE